MQQADSAGLDAHSSQTRDDGACQARNITRVYVRLTNVIVAWDRDYDIGGIDVLPDACREHLRCPIERKLGALRRQPARPPINSYVSEALEGLPFESLNNLEGDKVIR
jgi:hypothetical protein